MKTRKIKHYPWHRWFARKEFTLVEGQQYSCRTYSMQHSIYQAAKRYGVKVSISITTERKTDIIKVEVLGRRSEASAALLCLQENEVKQ
jgi:hypothetical protein